ncbi:MAG: hypothetical protein J6Z38_04420 [Lachnospiraceae bacterium]|nr:hypothetical protein [Lachnospiraceae bacterium]
MDVKQPQKKSAGKRFGMTLFVIAAVLLALFFFYTESYYHADRTAVMALRTDDYAVVTSSWTGVMFDGPGTEDLLIFYPGAKVEETAYAPLCHELAEAGLDVCLGGVAGGAEPDGAAHGPCRPGLHHRPG